MDKGKAAVGQKKPSAPPPIGKKPGVAPKVGSVSAKADTAARVTEQRGREVSSNHHAVLGSGQGKWLSCSAAKKKQITLFKKIVFVFVFDPYIIWIHVVSCVHLSGQLAGRQLFLCPSIFRG